MNSLRLDGRTLASGLYCALVLMAGCSQKSEPAPHTEAAPAPKPSYFKPDPATSGVVTGSIRMTGARPSPKLINMSEDPACVKANGGKAHDESLLVGSHGGVADAFVYIKSGLEGKDFEVAQTPVTIDQSGCWFHPRVLGLQVGQALRVVNSDPVTHNIHPMAEVNREWNHSQGPGDPPILRRFTKPEVMIPVKCNIHSWMHTFIGVLSHPYFTVTKPDGAFSIADLPPGTYTLGVWQQTLGTREQQITVQPHGKTVVDFNFKGK